MADSNGLPASVKRLKISKAQQYTILEVFGASLVLGVCIVLSIFLIKYIKFNTVIISAKNEAISEYDETLRNVGVCVDSDNNGRLSDRELENCDPSTTSLSSVSGSLRNNVLSVMAQNVDLESVARQRNENCYDADGKKIDFDKLYEESTDSLDKARYLQSAKICSALRVIPDALPAQKNTEALMASLNQVFLFTGLDPEQLAPLDDVVESEIEGVEVIPVQMRLEGTSAQVLTSLNAVERSIREFAITSATVEWSDVFGNGGLSVTAIANAYYLKDAGELEMTQEVTAADGVIESTTTEEEEEL